MALVDDLLKRHEKLLSRRSAYEALWQEIATYILPEKGAITAPANEGAKLTGNLYDSTAIDCNDKLASRLQSAMCSPALRWFGLHVRSAAVNDDTEVRQWFDAAAEDMSQAIAQSNFYSAIDEVFLDLTAFGMGALFCDERTPTRPQFNGLVFHAIPLGAVAVDEDAEGKVDTVFRTFTLSARAIKGRWPKATAPTLDRKVSEDPYATLDVLHAVYPREDGRQATLGPDGQVRRVPAAKMPIASCYVLKEDRVLLEESGYQEMPTAVCRWRKASGEVYGRGPGHVALPDTRSQNALRRELLTQIPLAVKPPLKVRHNGVLGTPRWQPGAVNVVRNMDDLQPMELTGSFEAAKLGMVELQAAIRSIYLVDQLQLKETPQMTAAEVYARMELMQQLLGPAFGRIQYELFNTLIERVFGIMARTGAFSQPVPERLLRYVQSQGGAWDIEYQSPLARAQRLPEVNAVERTYATAAVIREIQPDALDVLNGEEALKAVAEATGFPAKAIRSDEEVAAIREARAEQQANAQAIAETGAIAESAGKVAPFIQAITPQAAAA